jgi:Zn-dependent protease with chaperone function
VLVAAERPVTPRQRLATAVAYLLAVGFYGTLWGSIGALFFAATWFLAIDPRPLAGIPPWAIGGWCGFTGLFLVLAQFLEGMRRPAGRPLAREEAPGLFDLIDEVRDALDVAPVREVRLKPVPVIGVTRVWRRRRMFMRESKLLVLGLPLLRALTVDELRAAVAHELAHFAGGDVRRAQVVNAAWRRLALMRRVLRRGAPFLTWGNPVWWSLCAYQALLVRAAGAARRLQEARADSMAADVTGPQRFAQALVKLAALGLSFRRFAPGLLVRAGREGRRLENFFHELQEFQDGLAPLQRRRLVREVLQDEGKPGDEHPPLRERLSLLGVDRPPRRDREGTPAAGLFVDLPAIERELTPLALRGLAFGFGRRLRRRVRGGSATRS